jgi:3'(2'), 5'-bisphosphate nucleotidase
MKITHKFLKGILNPLQQTVIEASHAIMEVYKKDSFDHDIKSDGSPVTEADNRANDIIIRSLQEITPEIPIVSEETFNKEEENPKGSYWLVDPLDGTREFINKSKEFTVNIALIENGVPIFGIIGAPATGKIWSGSFFQRPTRMYRLGAMFFFMGPFAIIPWFIQHSSYGPHSMTKEMVGGKLVYKDGPIRLVMSKNHQTDHDKSFLEFLNKKSISYEVVEKGSSLKLCALADNEADIYPRFGPTCEWDIAAGHAYLISKGGRVCQMSSGEHLAYTKKDTILNPSFAGFRNTYLKDRYMPLLSEFYKKLV